MADGKSHRFHSGSHTVLVPSSIPPSLTLALHAAVPPRLRVAVPCPPLTFADAPATGLFTGTSMLELPSGQIL